MCGCGILHSTVAALRIAWVSSVLIVLYDGSPTIRLNAGKANPDLMSSLVGIFMVDMVCVLFEIYYCIVVVFRFVIINTTVIYFKCYFIILVLVVFDGVVVMPLCDVHVSFQFVSVRSFIQFYNVGFAVFRLVVGLVAAYFSIVLRCCFDVVALLVCHILSCCFVVALLCRVVILSAYRLL